MYGFTESFNLSVSAAICLSQLTSNLYKSDLNWKLTEETRSDLRLAWYKKIVRRAESLINEQLLSDNH
jgi:tRNA (guanosine-2'-O-)-methyltransferase